jgi:hypothetical protein
MCRPKPAVLYSARAVLSHFRHVTFIGDSLIRHFYAGLLFAQSGDMRYGSMKNGQSPPYHVPLPSEPPLDDAYRDKCVGEQQFHDKSGCWESLSWNSITGGDMGACCMDSLDLGLTWFTRPQSSNKSCGLRSPHFCGGTLDVAELHTDLEFGMSKVQRASARGSTVHSPKGGSEGPNTGIGDESGGTSSSSNSREELVNRQGYDSTGFVPPADPYWEKVRWRVK